MKISDLPVLSDAHGGAYLPVVYNGQNFRLYLSTIAASVENFTPYEPAETYSRDKPDFVSYNGNVYEYIGITPAAGKNPGTELDFWQLASAGRFTHLQNTDTHTVYPYFTAGKMQGFIPGQTEWESGFIFGSPGGVQNAALRFKGSTSEESEAPLRIQYCNHYTGTGSDVWEELGGGGNFKGAYVHGPKKTGEIWITAAGIWEVKQDFTSATAPTGNTAYWELIFAGGGTSYTDNQAKDAAAASIVAGTHSGIQFSYNAATKALSAEVTGIPSPDLAIRNMTASGSIELTDRGNAIETNISVANSITIPHSDTLAFPIGTQIIIHQGGVGQTEIVPASGVILRERYNRTKSSGQFANITIYQKTLNVWAIMGELA